MPMKTWRQGVSVMQKIAAERGGQVRVTGGCSGSCAAAAETGLLVGEGQRASSGCVRQSSQRLGQVSAVGTKPCGTIYPI